MKLTIKIDMDSAAFHDVSNSIEAARILREIARRFDEQGELSRGDARKLYDYNGNAVGEYRVTGR